MLPKRKPNAVKTNEENNKKPNKPISAKYLSTIKKTTLQHHTHNNAYVTTVLAPIFRTILAFMNEERPIKRAVNAK